MRPARIRRITLAVALLAVVAMSAVAWSASERVTTILNPPGANGGSDNVTFSQDNRDTRLIAYDSDASNIVPGDTNGVRDVFVHARSHPGPNGDFSGTDSMVSVSSAGVPGNGPSELAAIDGDYKHVPHCIAFQSSATNLDPAHGTQDTAVYLRDLRTRRTMLISIGKPNAQNASIDGKCELVSFDSNGTVYIRDLTKAKTIRVGVGFNAKLQHNSKAIAWVRGGHIYYQSFLRRFRAKNNLVMHGRSIMVDRAKTGEPGNGTAANPSMDDNGYYVAFESTSTNLCRPAVCAGVGGEDRNGATSDIFRRTVDPKRAPTHDYMQMASYSQGCTSSSPNSKTVDAQGNGPSNHPSMTGAGENIVFDSAADNLKESAAITIADPNGPIRDIYYWNFPRGRKCGNVSRESRSGAPREGGSGQPLNDNSENPASSNRANFIGFTSEQTGSFGEINGSATPDVFVRFLGGGPAG